jgi:nitrilase
VVEFEGWRFGLSICYDLRFPELYRALSAAGAEVLFVPAAFTVRTGMAHWHLLLRARAVENLAYVVAPAQVGTHFGQRETYGHALVVAPWGEVVAESEGGAGLIFAELKRERVAAVRAQIPALEHRRL